jgi:hypothetical protein
LYTHTHTHKYIHTYTHAQVVGGDESSAASPGDNFNANKADHLPRRGPGDANGLAGRGALDLNLMESALAALCNVLNNSEEAKQALHHEATSMQLLVTCLFSSSQRVREYSVGAIWSVCIYVCVYACTRGFSSNVC